MYGAKRRKHFSPQIPTPAYRRDRDNYVWRKKKKKQEKKRALITSDRPTHTCIGEIVICTALKQKGSIFTFDTYTSIGEIVICTALKQKGSIFTFDTAYTCIGEIVICTALKQMKHAVSIAPVSTADNLIHFVVACLGVVVCWVFFGGVAVVVLSLVSKC